MDLQSRLAEAIRISGKSRLQLAEEIGVTPSSISHWLTGRVKELRGQSATKIEEATGVRAAWLVSGTGPKLVCEQTGPSMSPALSRQIPCIAPEQIRTWLAEGDPYGPGKQPEWLLSSRLRSGRAFAQDITDDAMSPGFRPGDQIIIDPAVQPSPGDLVIACQAGQTPIFRKYRPRSLDAAGQPIFELAPLNDDHPTLSNVHSPIEILGTAVEHRRYLKG